MTGRRRISLFVPDLRGGGAERSVVELAAALSRRHTVEIITTSAVGPLAADVPAGVELVSLGGRRTLGSIFRLARHLRRSRPDGVISGLSHANVVAILARALARVDSALVVTEHNTLSVVTANATTKRDAILPLLMRAAYRRSDAVVAVSDGVADDLASRTALPRERVEVIRNAIDAEGIRERAQEPVRHAWFDPSRSWQTVVAVGRLAPAKDFGTLLAAMSEVRRHSDVRLVILGEGSERTALERRRDELGLGTSVEFKGFVQNPYAYLRRADLCVLSSRWEGLPTVLIEALVLGVPFVATDCPSGPREIRAGNEEWGTLVPVGDHRALASTVLEVLDSSASRQPPDLSAYDPDRVADSYLSVLGIGGD